MKNQNETQSILNLEPTSVFYISHSHYLNDLERFLFNKTIPSEEGIYLVNSLKPILVKDKKYFTRKGLETNKHIVGEEFNELKENIYDEDGVLVISSYIMENKQQFLKSKPIYNPAINKICINLINMHLANKCPMFSDSSYEQEILNLLLPEFHHYVKDNTLFLALDELMIDIDNFIGGDNWHIYFVKELGSDLEFVKTYDFRIYEWTKKTFLKED